MATALRAPTRRAAASSPAGVAVAHLVAAASDARRAGAGALAQELAVAGLRLATTTAAPLPRGSTHAMCPSCGTPYAASDYVTATVILLRRPPRRVRKAAAVARAAATASRRPPPAPKNTAGLMLSCGACGKARLRRFYSRELAEAARVAGVAA